MRRFAAALVGAVLILGVPVGALRADPVGTGSEQGPRTEVVCASWDESSTEVCGGRSTADGVTEVFVDIYTYSCDGTFCTGRSGRQFVADDAVLIDQEGGTAEIDATVFDCAVAVTFTATGDPTTLAVPHFPEAGITDGSVKVRAGATDYSSRRADATGSVCDVSGPADYAYFVVNNNRAESLYVTPASDSGVLEINTGRHHESEYETVCAYWDGTNGSYDSTRVCGTDYYDAWWGSDYVSVSSYTCYDEADGSYWCESSSAGDDVAEEDVVVDFEGGTANVTTTLSSCAIDVAYTATEEAQPWSSGGTAVWPELRDDGEVRVHVGGNSYWDRWADASGTVCGTEMDNSGYAYFTRYGTDSYFVGVNPTSVLPGN